MKMPWQKTTWENSIKSNVALSFAVAVLSILVAVLLNMLISVYDRQRIVLTPPVVDKQMIVGWDSANEEYYKSIGLYVATLVGNVSVSNAKFVADGMAQIIEPSEASEVRGVILAIAETRTFKEAAASTKYVPSAVLYEASTKKVFVSGTMDVLGAGLASQTQSLTYEMQIQMKSGRPYISKLTSYSGISPHTEKWLKEHPILEEGSTK